MTDKFFEIVFSIFKTRKRCFIESVGNSKHVDNVLLKAPGKRDSMMAGFEGIHLFDIFYSSFHDIDHSST